jgi:hypothetical protein
VSFCYCLTQFKRKKNQEIKLSNIRTKQMFSKSLFSLLEKSMKEIKYVNQKWKKNMKNKNEIYTCKSIYKGIL